MSRIIGWNKKLDHDNFISYENKISSELDSDIIIERFYDKWGLWVRLNKAREGTIKFLHEEEFDTKAEPQRFAIDWMRDHPEG